MIKKQEGFHKRGPFSLNDLMKDEPYAFKYPFLKKVQSGSHSEKA